MSFLHVSLLFGSLAALAPVLFHMLGRRQPRVLDFPAIRFVKKTAVEAQRGWSVKRWILLALRVLLVCVLAAALAAPRVASGVFANALMGGLFGLLALLSSVAAIVLWGRRRGALAIAIPALVASLLWAGTAYFGWSVYTRSNASPLTNSEGPVCAAIVVDTSPTMGYKFHGKSRLEDAKEMARWLMDRLPLGSEIVILGSEAGGRVNQDRLSAERQLDRVLVEGKAADLIERIQTGIDTVRKSKFDRREVYVLSDMRENAWKGVASSELGSVISGEVSKANNAQEASKADAGTVNASTGGGLLSGERQPKVLVQIIDVGVPDKEIRNWSLDKLKLSSESVVPNGSVTIQADLKALQGDAKEQIMVELSAEPVEKKVSTNNDGDWQLPEPKLIDRQVVQAIDQGTASVQFQWKDLAEGTNHAVLKLARPDPLEIDNTFYITIEAVDQGKSLVICDDSNDGKLVSLILDPGTELREEKPGEARSGVDVEPRSRIGQIELPKYSSIVLFNPSELTADEADRLSAWVNNGGGLVIILGPAAVGPGAVGGAGLPNAPPVPVGSTLLERSAQGGLASLLPGKVRGITQIPLDGDLVVIRPKAEGHPIWNIFERPASEIPWVNYPVRQHWNLEGLDPASSVIANFTQSELPMLVETIRGSGRIIVMTVPYPEPGATAAQGAWSELFTTSSDAWPGFAFFLSTVRYLATQSKHPVNYSVGSTAILENNPKEFPRMYELRQPSGELVRVEADEEGLSYPFTQQSGHYRLRGSRARGPLVRGFSVNVAREEVSLKSIERESLAKAFGEGNLWIAKTKEEVQSSIGEGRYGRDLGPFLWVILAMMVMAEQTMSSRFYASQQRGRS